MVRARLHIICGNCGSNNDFEFEHREEEKEEQCPETTWIWCENCSTLHDIADNAKLRKR